MLRGMLGVETRAHMAVSNEFSSVTAANEGSFFWNVVMPWVTLKP